MFNLCFYCSIIQLVYLGQGKNAIAWRITYWLNRLSHPRFVFFMKLFVPILRVLYFHFLQAYFANAKGVFELQRIKVLSSSNRLQSGRCCGTVLSSAEGCVQSCLMYLDICLRPFDIKGSRDCVVQGFSSTLLDGNHPEALDGHSAVISFTISWPGAFALFLKGVSNSTSVSDNIVFEAFFPEEIKPNQTWVPRLHNSTQISLRFDSRLICSEDYFGPYCSVHCVDRNDMFGHWKCDPLGQKICLSGWNGTYCTEPVCDPPCQNGSCQAKGIERFCQCDPGRSGLLCEKCLSHAACGHGICANSVCTCQPGWGGTNCTKVTDFCFLNKPCFNGGTCRNLDDTRKFECDCALPYQGIVCEKHLLTCEPNICQNGGTCQTDKNTISCTCLPNFTGALCQKIVSLCALQPCMHNGTCVEEGSIRRCLCQHGTFGADCEYTTSSGPHSLLTEISLPTSHATVTHDEGATTWSSLSLYPSHSWTNVLSTSVYYTEKGLKSERYMYESTVGNNFLSFTSSIELSTGSSHLASEMSSSGNNNDTTTLAVTSAESTHYTLSTKDSLLEASTWMSSPAMLLSSRPIKTLRSLYVSTMDSSTIIPTSSWIQVDSTSQAEALTISVTMIPTTSCLESCQQDRSSVLRVITVLSACASLLVLLVVVTLLLWKRSACKNLRKGARRSWQPGHSGLPRCVITLGHGSIGSRASVFPSAGKDNRGCDRDSGTCEDPPIADVISVTSFPAPELQDEIEEVSLEPERDFERYTVQAVDRICMQAIREVRQKNKNLIQENSLSRGNAPSGKTIESSLAIRGDLAKTHSNASRTSQASSGYSSSASRSNSRAGSANSRDNTGSTSLPTTRPGQAQSNLLSHYQRGDAKGSYSCHVETASRTAMKPKNTAIGGMSLNSSESEICHSRKVFKETHYDGLPNYIMDKEESL